MLHWANNSSQDKIQAFSFWRFKENWLWTFPNITKKDKEEKVKIKAKHCKAFIVDWIKYCEWLKVVRVSRLPDKTGSPSHPSAMTLSFPSLAWPAQSGSDRPWHCLPWGKNLEIAALCQCMLGNLKTSRFWVCYLNQCLVHREKKTKTTMQGKGKMWYKVWELHMCG